MYVLKQILILRVFDCSINVSLSTAFDSKSF